MCTKSYSTRFLCLSLHFFIKLFRVLFFSDTKLPPHRDTQLPFDMLFITMLYTCHVTEVVNHKGGGTVK